MKKFFATLILILFCTVCNSYASTDVFPFTSLTGGGSGALDAIDVTNDGIDNGDKALGCDTTWCYDYNFNSSSGAAESSPDVIKPDNDAGAAYSGNGRWILLSRKMSDLTLSDDLVVGDDASVTGSLTTADLRLGGAGATLDEFSTDGTMAGNSDTAAPTEQAVVEYVGSKIGFKNLLINGCMRLAQRSTSITDTGYVKNNDDSYTLDRWNLLSDGNNIVDVSRQSSGGVSTIDNYIRLDVETAEKKFGIVQIVENANLKNIIGNSVSLSFDAKVTNNTKLSDIRAVVLSWSSTADEVTSDVISAWGAEGVNPTYAANWTAENTASNLSVTTSWARYSIANISIDTASTTNIAVFIYQNNVATNDTAGIYLEVTNVQLEYGSVATSFEYRPIGQEIDLAQRYFEKSYDTDQTLGQQNYLGSVGYTNGRTGTNQEINVRFITRKRTKPTVVLFSVYSGANGTVYNQTDTASPACVADTDYIGYIGFGRLTYDASSDQDDRIYFHYTADAEL